MKNYFTYEQLQQAANEGKQAFNSGKPFICPYVGAESIPLRVKWINSYNHARKQFEGYSINARNNYV